MGTANPQYPIHLHGVVGNLQTVALIAHDGTVTWLCAPYLHSPSVFAAILDHERGGYWQLRPLSSHARFEQSYHPHTAILTTRFTTPEGGGEVVDFMPIEELATDAPSYLTQSIAASTVLRRRVVCLWGTCHLTSVFAPRFDYARITPVVQTGEGGVVARSGSHSAFLASTLPHEVSGGKVARASFTLRAGERAYFTFRYGATRAMEEDAPPHHEADLAHTSAFWRSWVEECDGRACRFPHQWRDEVVRSLITLKLLFFEPMGTVAAAATTSLPEAPDGERNWDYRYVWLRDASFTFQALFRAGHTAEARRFLAFLVDKAQALRRGSDLAIMYTLDGKEVPAEEVLDHLRGYGEARPVRIGNAAASQRQWDIYGSIMETLWRYYRLTGRTVISPQRWLLVEAIAERARQVWREPDEGIWEVRTKPQHFTYSKVMCWVALDRALRIARICGIPTPHATIWREERERIRDTVLREGYHEELQSFTQTFGGTAVDAALLLLPAVGFIDAKDPRMRSTVTRIERELGVPPQHTLLYRYRVADGLHGAEGAFLVASFWLVDAHYLGGDYDRAHEVMEATLRRANSLGLFSEEIDPATGAFLGNFPQAYTHIGLINSAFLLAQGEV